MTDPDSPTDADDATRDSLTDAFDASAGDVAAFVARLDAADDLLVAAADAVRAVRGDADADAGGDSDVSAALRDATDGSDVPVSGDAVAAAAETAAELHREGALSGASDAVSRDDAVRVLEALLDAYGDPDVEGSAGYLVAAASALGGDSDESDSDAA